MKKTLEAFIKDERKKGGLCFSLNEAIRYLAVSDKAAKQALFRYVKKGDIAVVRKGFYAIIPPEYSDRGMLPEYLFIDDMMKWLERPYYLGLFSAAALHGAAHQQPMESFIMTVKPPLRSIRNEKIAINFLTRNGWDDQDTEHKKTDAGYVTVSTAELTALDFMYHLRHTGINRAVTVVTELAEVMRSSTLVETARRYGRTSAIQRLGYILATTVGNTALSGALHELLTGMNVHYIPLSPGEGKRGEFVPRWKIIRNVDVESDL